MNEPRGFEVIGTRHSKSNYETYIRDKSAGKKEFDPRDQIYPDLSETGIELAQKEAAVFFDNLDPKKDKLFFISSNEARAIATADIYRQEALSRGFEIIKPGKTNSELSDRETDGYVRVSRALSLNPKNYALHSIFVASLPEKVQKIIADELPENIKEKWLEARKIINNAPEELKKKGWGEMFYQYSDQVQEIFPDIKSSKDLERQFNTIVKLIQWGKDKFSESNMDGNMKVLGFGHENYVASILDKKLGEHEIGNCESIIININDEMGVDVKKMKNLQKIKI